MLGKKIAMGHYGIGGKDGVNTVMSRNIKAIFKDLEKDVHITLFGAADPLIGDFIKRSGGEKRLDYVDIPEFAAGYNDRRINDQDPIDYMYEGEKIADKLAAALEGYDLIMMENTTVGNHPAVSYAFYVYTRWCMNHEPTKRFIFRTHDFMQDRPTNFSNVKKFRPRRSRFVPDWHQIFYPTLPNIYYMAISTTGMRELFSHGIDGDTIYYLPNSIDDNLMVPDEKYKGLRDAVNQRFGLDDATKIIYYPVRCVPRKNVEEAILLTVLANRIARKDTQLYKKDVVSGDYHLIVSLDNHSPKTGIYAEKIKEFVKANNLPVTIGFGDLLNLERGFDDDGKMKNWGIADAYAISEIVVTTSILEGFGFVYIEPWMVDCLVIGRNLPMVTNDFTKLGGLELGHLYNVLMADGVDFRELGREPDLLNTSFNDLDLDSMKAKFDFIERLHDDDDVYNDFIEHNRFQLNATFTVLEAETERKVIDCNRDAVETNYSRESVAQRLYEIMLEVLTRDNGDSTATMKRK
ncbi:hypothetical protein ACFL4W_04470 [Planctomycetota bacterium]